MVYFELDERSGKFEPLNVRMIPFAVELTIVRTCPVDPPLAILNSFPTGLIGTTFEETCTTFPEPL